MIHVSIQYSPSSCIEIWLSGKIWGTTNICDTATAGWRNFTPRFGTRFVAELCSSFFCWCALRCAVHDDVGEWLVNGWIFRHFYVEVCGSQILPGIKGWWFSKKNQFSADLGCEMNRLNLMTGRKPWFTNQVSCRILKQRQKPWLQYCLLLMWRNTKRWFCHIFFNRDHWYIYIDMISCDITQISFRNWGFCQVAARIHLVQERWWSETTTMWCQERRAAPWAVHSHTGRCENTDVWTWWKSQKKTGTKLVLDVSNDAISIHIYFRPVHEWLLLTNELSSPPKSWWMMPCSLC